MLTYLTDYFAHNLRYIVERFLGFANNYFTSLIKKLIAKMVVYYSMIGTQIAVKKKYLIWNTYYLDFFQLNVFKTIIYQTYLINTQINFENIHLFKLCLKNTKE